MKLTPAERGLGAEHQRRRRVMPKPQGDPCPFCELPMWPDDKLDLDHVFLRARGGAGGPVRWSHRSCNRRAGGKVQSQFRIRRAVRSRRW